MVRLSRAGVFDSNEIAVAHAYNQKVRECFLMGDDPVSGKNLDRRTPSPIRRCLWDRPARICDPFQPLSSDTSLSPRCRRYLG